MPHASFPPALHAFAIASLLIAGACASGIAIDLVRRPQKMWIMYLVWPLTALFGSVLWLAAYWHWGRAPAPHQKREALPFPVMVGKGASHCGAGCTLGDLIAEWLAFAVPSIAVAFGWHSVFAEKIFAIWILDLLLAFAIGVAFQYFTIKPMRDLSVAQGIIAALNADIASITAWQVGMYGLMGLIQFAWFRPMFGGTAEVATPEFWFAMQPAMLAGFATAYPVNWWLIQRGLKEKM